MSSTNTGGPAFPTKSYNVEREVMTLEEGMTLRDYFAAKALQGICGVTGVDFGGPDEVARITYKLADAMLKARES